MSKLQIRLKEMSHKKLRKLAKGLADELKSMSDLASHRGEQWNKYKELTLKLDKEKQELVERLQSLQEANSNLKKWNDDKDKRIADLEHALDALGYVAEGSTGTAVINGMKMTTAGIGKSNYIGEMPANLNMGVDGQLRESPKPFQDLKTHREVWKEALGIAYNEATEEKSDYWSQEIKVFNETMDALIAYDSYMLRQRSEDMTDEQHAEFVASEVARVQWGGDEEIELGHIPAKPTGVADSMALGTLYHQQVEERKVDLVGSLFDVPQGNDVLPQPADVDEAVEWAKRNGHHFPNGRPDVDRSTSVVVTHPEAISQENRAKHSEMSDICSHPNMAVISPGTAQCTDCGKYL